MNNLPYRFTIILSVLLVSCYLLYPTYQYYSIDKNELDLYSADEQKELKTKALSLGLDLQGGISVLLECDLPALLESICIQSRGSDGCPSELIKTFNESNIPGKDFFNELETNLNEKDIALIDFYKDYFGEKRTSKLPNSEVIEMLKNERDISIQNAIRIIKTRLNSTGLGDPNIQQLGNNRINIELAGVTEKKRIMGLIEGTGKLEFRLVYSAAETVQKINEIDNYLASKERTPFSYYNIFYNSPEYAEYGLIWVELEHIEKVDSIFKSEDIIKKLNKGIFVWGNKVESMPDVNEGLSYKNLYYVKDKIEISGGDLKSSEAAIAPPEQRHQTGKYVIDVEMGDEGTKKWRRTTGKNVGSRVAIILDDEIYMAPVINDRIPNGRTQISGLESFQEAEDIVTVLAAGEMDAFKVGEARLIGSSLGADAIEAGKKSIIIGLILVIIFMIIYYRLAGLVASTAMLMNLIMIVAALAMFGWVDEDMMVTLTLPGIAGLILTIGMTVDANVIIFERIKEELKTNKTIGRAIESAYQRALVTILDANFTTLIAAIVLAGIGSGPIKGFAITLGVGIVCSMFTAIFVTKTIFLSFPNFNFMTLKNDNKGILQ